MAVEGYMSKQPAHPSLYPSILGVTITTFGSSLLLAQPFGEGTMEKQPAGNREYFLFYIISGESPSALNTTAGPSFWQLNGTQMWHRGTWSAWVCPGRNPIYPLSNLLWHTGLLILAAATSVGVPEAAAPGQGVRERRCRRIVTVNLYVDTLWVGKSLSYKFLLWDKAMFSAQISRYVLSGVILVCQHSPLAHLMESGAGWSSHLTWPGIAICSAPGISQQSK